MVDRADHGEQGVLNRRSPLPRCEWCGALMPKTELAEAANEISICIVCDHRNRGAESLDGFGFGILPLSWHAKRAQFRRNYYLASHIGMYRTEIIVVAEVVENQTVTLPRHDCV